MQTEIVQIAKLDTELWTEDHEAFRNGVFDTWFLIGTIRVWTVYSEQLHLQVDTKIYSVYSEITVSCP
jgi:hypothetical protein